MYYTLFESKADNVFAHFRGNQTPRHPAPKREPMITSVTLIILICSAVITLTKSEALFSKGDNTGGGF